MRYLPLLFLLGLPRLIYSGDTNDSSLPEATFQRTDLPDVDPVTIRSTSEETETQDEYSDVVPSTTEISQTRSKNAYILLIGLSGAGKSSTLNFLFGDREIAKIGESDSTSSNPLINEYVFQVPGDDTESELHIIDTPGLSSPKGVDHDARTISALENYLVNLPELNNTVPNVVLLFAHFDDNRMQGNNSRFVSMLKGYELLKHRFTDSSGKTASNIVFVFTKLLSETKSKSKKPGAKLEIFQNIIKEHTSYPEPIVLAVADNAIKDEEDPVKDIDENYKLPNKEWYPKNLIDKMIESCENRTDSSCVSILKSVFAQRHNITFELLDEQSAPAKAVEANKDLYARQFNIETTPVSQALAEAYEKIDPELRNTNRGSLEILQVGFQRKGIRNIADVPRDADKIITFLQGMNMDLAMVATFERAFRAVVPQYPFDMLTGNGYDVVEDAQLRKSPFLLNKFKFSQAGYMIPDTMTLTLENENHNILNFYDNFQDMISSRSRHLGLQEDVQVDSSERNIRPGENVINRWGRSSQQVSVTAVHECRTFQLLLNENVDFKPEFRTRIESMPEFDLSDRHSVAEWKNLFDEYGAYIVVSAYGGGTIETKITVKNEELAKLRNKTFDSIRDIVESLPQHNRLPKEFQNAWNLVEFEFSYKGGDPQYIEGNLAELSLAKAMASLEKWKETLTTEPVMLESKIQLLPLSEFVKQINSSIANEMEAARKALVEGRLEYVQPTVDDVLTTTEDDNTVPKFEEETAEVPEYKKRLDDFEKTLQKSRDEQERIQQELLERMRNFTIEADRITVAPPTTRPTTPKPRPTNRPRKRTTTKRPYYPKPPLTTTTTPKPTYNYNFVYEPPKSTETCNRKEGCYKQTGLSYDVVTDRALNKSPFQPYADIFCKYLPLDQPDQYTPYYVYQNFETIEEYIDFRQHVLGTGLKLSRYQYRGALVPGHHIFHQNGYMSISIEYRLYENRIKSACSHLDGEFVDEVRALPMYYDTSCASMNIWKRFIQKFGTHFVNSSYVGGYINVRPLGAFKYKIINTYLNNQEQLRNFFAKLNWQNESFEFEVTGGDRTILKTTRDFTKDNFRRWSTSLRTEGADSLKNDLMVNSLAPLIGRLKPALVDSFQIASKDHFSGYLGRCNGDAWTQPCTELNNEQDCYSLANTSCEWFDPGQHYCVLNSECVPYGRNSRNGICRCLPGAVFMRPGKCYREVY